MKKILCTLLTVAIVMSFAGCVMSKYKDTNGESDFSLQTITDADILQGTGTSKLMYSKFTINNKTEFKAKTMSGVETVWERRLSDETLELTVSSTFTKGNARLVLLVDDEIVHDFSLNEQDQQFNLEHVTGKVRLKLACESAGFSVTYEWKRF